MSFENLKRTGALFGGLSIIFVNTFLWTDVFAHKFTWEDFTEEAYPKNLLKFLQAAYSVTVAEKILLPFYAAGIAGIVYGLSGKTESSKESEK